jgi:uncharacterized protein with gpF-like domain
MHKLLNNAPISKVIRAVHPNTGIQVWLAGALHGMLHDAITDAILILTRVWSQTPPVVGIAMDAGVVESCAYETYGVGPDGYIIESTREWHPARYMLAQDAPSSTKALDRVMRQWGKKWARKFDKLSVETAQRFAKRSFAATDISFRQALKDAGFTVAFRPSRRILESYKLVVAENVGLIRNLQSSLYSKIQQDVWASVRAGADMHTLSEKLMKSHGVEARRASLIARDQNAKAKAVIETARRQQLGLRQAIWQHSGAGREFRPVHVAWGREGKVYDLDTGLYDPDEGRYVFPGELINCGCTSRAIVPGYNDEDEDGDED